MTTQALLARLHAAGIRLRSNGGELAVSGARERLDDSLLGELRAHKSALLELVESDGWWTPPAAITPDMLTLVDLTQEQIDAITAAIPGGAANVQDIYPLAPLQEGILFHHLLSNEGDTYLLVTMLRFDSRERLDAYLDATQAVIDRHDILRTSMAWDGLPEPVQVVWRAASLPIEEVMLDPAAGDVAGQLYERFHPRHTRIDVAHAPLMRASIAREVGGAWILLMLRHHLIGDHTTVELRSAEIEAHLLGKGGDLPPALPFRNYIAQARLGMSRQEHEDFFRGMLAGVDEPTAPLGLLDVQGDGSAVAEAQVDLDVALGLRLRERARKLGVSTASVCHLAWALVLSHLTGRDDVVFGTILFGRMQGGEGADRAMGLFINTLPVRIRIGDADVEASVRGVHTLLANLMRHEHASLALAQRCSSVPAPTPLFSSLLNYRHGLRATGVSESAKAWEGITRVYVEERTNYPFGLSVDDRADGFQLTAQVDAAADPARVCEAMRRAIEALVVALETAPAQPLQSLDIMSAGERRLVVEEWNATGEEYRRDAAAHELFEEQVLRTPQTKAVAQEDEALTFDELNRRANRLCHDLLRRGVGRDARVAVCMERGGDLIAALLAVWKAGGAYVPLDPAYPAERLRFMLRDSAPAVVLTETSLLDRFDGEALPVIDLSAAWPDEDEANPRVAVGDVAAVLYTSGSTGTPKGVLVAHRGLSNLSVLHARRLGVTAESRILQFASPSFDGFLFELLMALAHGATLCLPPRGTVAAGETLIGTVERHGVTHAVLPPSVLAALPEEAALDSIETLIVSGDASSGALMNRWMRGRRLINGYGLTETTVCATLHDYRESDAQHPPIGRPIGNVRVYILDRRGRPVPPGVIGEIHVGGDGVALGYLDRPELTAERFAIDPFHGGRMYKTGDRGRWLADGTIEFHGRNDFQLKVRGFRVEPGEVEARLAGHAAVREVVVVARDQRLVAYYTGQATADALRAHAAESMPEHMVPAAYVRLDNLPLTPNGKVDRKALPAPEGDAFVSRGYEAPEGEREAALAEIWAEVLKVPRVGRYDNFFELGGHSLLAVTMMERMRRRGLHIDVRAVFSAPTLAELALAAGGGVRDIEVPPNAIPIGYAAITPDMLPLVTLSQAEIDRIVATVPGGAANMQDVYPLAPLQEGILFHHLMAEQGDAYLQASLYSFDTREALDAYLGALQEVVSRHDILRTAVQWEGLPEPVQVVWRRATLPVEEVTLDSASDGARQLYARFDPRRYRIDVGQAPLLRVCIARDATQDRWLFLLLLHHLFGDHTTLVGIRDEVELVLAGERDRLAEPLPFRNYVAQARLGVSREEHEAFFRRMLADVEEPTAPFGLLDVQGDGSGIDEARLMVDAALAARVRERARRLGMSAATLWHVAWAQVLSRVAGRDDVVFGTVLLGRMQGGQGSDRTMGLFINTLPLRIRIGDERVESAVRRAQELLSDLMRHEHASLALAQRCSGVPQPAPLFTSLLNYRHSAVVKKSERPKAVQRMRLLRAEERSNYPLMLSVDDLGEGFHLTAVVDKTIDARRVCDFVVNAVAELVEALETAPSKAIRDVDVLPHDERQQLLGPLKGSETVYPTDVCLHELFEAQVERTPDAIAIVHGERSWTYRELNARANRLAHFLRAQGVGQDVRLGLCVERSAEMVAALLAVLKAGGTYVPLESAYPAERLRFMIEDTAPAAVLTQPSLAALFASDGLPLIDIEADPSEQPATNLDRNGLRPDHLAYVIYTSGSTGKPKGVMAHHRGVVNYLHAIRDRIGMSAEDRVLLTTTLAFDPSVQEIFLPLMTGARIVIVERAATADPELLAAAIERAEATLMHATPLTWRMLLEWGWKGSKKLRGLCGGESMTVEMAARMRERIAAFWNIYGPTEITLYATAQLAEEGVADTKNEIPVGRPLANEKVYILDPQGRLAPIGVAGEICIGGPGVARGYLNREALTAERFVRDPFATEPDARMYRSGDLGRWLPDGTIEFLGRNDFQVKVRGFRVELGEIEARLKEYPGIRKAVLIAREDTPGDKRLVAYYAGDEMVEVEKLRGHLAATLPDYMVPAAYVWLEAFPTSPTGKLDRKALPVPEGDAYVARGYEEPVGEVETALAEIWAEILKAERVGRHDNFFELGGHSLLAVTLIERMRRRGLHADVRAIFATPTVAELATTIDGGASHAFEVPENRIPDFKDDTRSLKLIL